MLFCVATGKSRMKDLPFVARMLAVELLDVTVNTVSKAAMRKGMNDFVFVMYSNAFAACFLFLITFFHYRNTTLPLLSYDIVGLLFVVGLLSCTDQMLKFFGIGYSSPTLASALSDLVPAFTSILAVIFRMEKFDWKANSTRAKSIGTFLSIGGALIISLKKGKAVINNDLSLKLFPQKLASSTEFDWVFGATLLAARSCFVSINFVLMTWIVVKYPEEKVVTFIRIALTSMLSVPAAVISVKDRKDLRLGFNMELIAIACSAIFVLSFRRLTHTCALRKGGPVYVAMFKPLKRVFAVILGITFLGDSLYVGSVIGAIIIVIGFHAAIWGKSEEKSEEDSAGMSEEDRPGCCYSQVAENLLN